MRVLHRAAEIPVTCSQDPRRFGHFIARADLLIEGTRRLQEYDGAGHREADVHANDLARDRCCSLTTGSGMATSRGLLAGGAQIIADVDRTLGVLGQSPAAPGNTCSALALRPPGRARAYRQWRRALR